MHKKAAICVLIITAGILMLSIYMLFFGKSGFVNAGRRNTSEISSGKAEDIQAAEEETDREKKPDLTASETSGNSAEKSQEEIQKVKGNSDTTLVFSVGSDSDAARILPQEVIDAIEAINQGEMLDQVIGMEELKGYYALTTTHVIIARDKETEEESTGNGRLTLYVPNLVEGLSDVSVLFYDCTEGEWRVIPVEKMDVAGKRVSVNINGSGVVTTIHRPEK